MSWLLPLALVLLVGAIIAAGHFLVMRWLVRASAPAEDGKPGAKDIRH